MKLVWIKMSMEWKCPRNDKCPLFNEIFGVWSWFELEMPMQWKYPWNEKCLDFSKAFGV